MPSKSAKQHRFMEMVAHDPKAAKRVGVPSSVGREFVATDKGKKSKEGSVMKKPSKKTVYKGKESAAEERAEAKMGKYKKGGKTRCFAEGGELDNASQPGAYAGLRAQAQRLKREAEAAKMVKNNNTDVPYPYSNRNGDDGSRAVGVSVKPYDPAAKKADVKPDIGEPLRKYREGKTGGGTDLGQAIRDMKTPSSNASSNSTPVTSKSAAKPAAKNQYKTNF